MTEAGPTHYEVLGVATDAPTEDVRRAYLRLARQNHPDAHAAGSAAARTEADRRMQSINAAWTVLGDVARRRRYDHELGLSDAARVADSREGFVPFHPDDDDPDPRTAPDVPYEGAVPATGARRVATFAPVAVFAASVASLGSGLWFGAPFLVALGGILFLLSCLLLAVVPLMYLADARRHDR